MAVDRKGVRGGSDGVGEIARKVGPADQVAELADRLDEQTGSGSDAIRSAALSARRSQL